VSANKAIPPSQPSSQPPPDEIHRQPFDWVGTGGVPVKAVRGGAAREHVEVLNPNWLMRRCAAGVIREVRRFHTGVGMEGKRPLEQVGEEGPNKRVAQQFDDETGNGDANETVYRLLVPFRKVRAPQGCCNAEPRSHIAPWLAWLGCNHRRNRRRQSTRSRVDRLTHTTDAGTRLAGGRGHRQGRHHHQAAARGDWRQNQGG
jgi:hypothetical protein